MSRVLKLSPNLIGRFVGSLGRLEFTSSELIVTDKQGNESSFAYTQLADIPKVNRKIFGTTLTVLLGQSTLKFSYLPAKASEDAHKYLVSQAIKQLEWDIKEAKNILKKKAHDEYFRNSSVAIVEKILLPVLSKYNASKAVWDSHLDERSVHALSMFSKIIPLTEGADILRKGFENGMLKERSDFFDHIETNPLTLQQRKAVVRNNDLNLVLAAAGTGKTSVMVAKAIDMIDSQRAEGKEVLVLAFNNSAARELKERVQKRGEQHNVGELNSPNISTFHALGRKILNECRIPVRMSVMTEDPMRMKVWVTSRLCQYIKASTAGLQRFILLTYQPVNPFDFTNLAEYEAHCRDNEHRTLQGELVKGYQEWLIANWLFLQGIEYEYEADYVSKRRIEIGFDYKPDFHFPGTNIYLEHFGVSRDGSTRPDIDRGKYNESMLSKRALHEECGTILIETYHYDWIEGQLEERLASLVDDCGFVREPRSDDEIFDVLNDQGFIDQSAEQYTKCLQAVRAERLDKAALYERLVHAKISFASDYTELIINLHDDYVAELIETNSIDFDDMIIRSTQLVESGSYKPSWKHILVDEFQDISMARMLFLRALIDHGPNPSLTAVGDDWQSIYRFAGGKLELTTRFESLIGIHSLTKLERTFRYNSSIASTAGKFVMENPEQYVKNVEAHEQVDSSQVYLLDSTRKEGSQLEDRTLQIIRTIREQDAEGSIAILARYHYLLKAVREKAKPEFGRDNINFWTFHGAKGLEADYCILIGFFKGKSGFPNSNQDSAVVEALLPTLDVFDHSEERRLLYVGLTRARKKSYLIADATAPSVFIEELLTPKHDLHIASKHFEKRYRKVFKCPLCIEGYFRKFNGKYGEFFSCTSGTACIAKPRVCEKCGSPSMDNRKTSICNNEACNHLKEICDICGRPMKERNSQYGKFLGCTGFGIPDDQCKNTRRV